MEPKLPVAAVISTAWYASQFSGATREDSQLLSLRSSSLLFERVNLSSSSGLVDASRSLVSRQTVRDLSGGPCKTAPRGRALLACVANCLRGRHPQDGCLAGWLQAPCLCNTRQNG
jgi:hypothetical protein